MFPSRPVAIPDTAFELDMQRYGNRVYGTPEDYAVMTTGTPINLQQNAPQPQPMPQHGLQPLPQQMPPQMPQQMTATQGPVHGVSPQAPAYLTNSAAPQIPYQPGQYDGHFQNLAMQMAGFPGPSVSGVRSSPQMGVTPYTPGGGGNAPAPGGYDGADPNINQNLNGQSPALNPNWLHNGGENLGTGGGGSIPSNQGWVNNYVDQFGGGNSGSLGVDLPSLGGTVGGALSAGGSILNTLVNPLGALIGAITNDGEESTEDEETAAPDENRSPAPTGNPQFGQFGATPGTPGVYDPDPIGTLVSGGTSQIDHILRRLMPSFGVR